MAAWLQVRVEVEPGQVEAVELALTDAGAQALTLEDAADQPILEPTPGTVPLWPLVRLVALFDDGECSREQIQASIARSLPGAEPPRIVFDLLADREWSRAWLDDWQPLAFGRRLWVAPIGAVLKQPDAVVVRLDPGLAFGTGTHPTTALCLEWLDQADPAGADVLDFGCGSGILAIASLLLGARSAVAADIDPQALEATRSNACMNGVAAGLQAVEADCLMDGAFHVVLANILAGPLTESAGRLAAMQRSGGRIVLSGILREQADGVIAAYRHAYDIDAGAEREGWVRLDGVRR